MPRKTKKLPSGIYSEQRRANFTVTNAQKTFHSPAVEDLLMESSAMLHNKQWAQSEKLVRQAITLEPIQPDMLNNLASSLMMQNRNSEAEAVLQTTHLLFPDYLFARTGLARNAIKKGNYFRAVELLEPLLERTNFHESEFTALCNTQIELSVAMNDLPAARTWFKMWEECCSQHPNLDYYRRMVA